MRHSHQPHRGQPDLATMAAVMFHGLVMLLACGCSIWRDKPAIQTTPAQHQIIRGQLVIYSDTPLPKQHRMIEELSVQRTDVLERLNLPASDEPIHVYLFDTGERFNTFMRLQYPDFPSRRAFFVETDTRLAVYAHWGDRVAEDLRHEVAHGYLHSVVPNLPLWLDEGLAEYFEVPRGQHGVNVPHITDLATRMPGGWRPDLRRLEALGAIGDMRQIDYAESWLWVHWMLDHPQRLELLRTHLQRLRRDGTSEPLSLQMRRLMPHPEGELLGHLQKLAVQY